MSEGARSLHLRISNVKSWRQGGTCATPTVLWYLLHCAWSGCGMRDQHAGRQHQLDHQNETQDRVSGLHENEPVRCNLMQDNAIQTKTQDQKAEKVLPSGKLRILGLLAKVWHSDNWDAQAQCWWCLSHLAKAITVHVSCKIEYLVRSSKRLLIKPAT